MYFCVFSRYGDLVPRGYTGRCIGIVWILTGLVLVSLFSSVVTFSLTASVIDQNIMLYGTRVMTGLLPCFFSYVWDLEIIFPSC